MTDTPPPNAALAALEVPRTGRNGPVDATRVPRYAGDSTFARLPRFADARDSTTLVWGIPFDTGVSYRPGARFGPNHVRQASRLLRPFNPALAVEPLDSVADAGDLGVNPFDIAEALITIDNAARELLGAGRTLITIGGDHTIALPLLRAHATASGPVAVLHFDSHLDTWDTYFGAPQTHGTPFRRASEEGLIDQNHSVHVGLRGPLYHRLDLTESEQLGFTAIHARDFARHSLDELIDRIRRRLGDRPVYVSIDIDVLDPAFAPGTGTPEAGGISTRELLEILRGLDGLAIVGADVVEVAPAYDHAEITGIAASHVIYELLSVIPRKGA